MGKKNMENNNFLKITGIVLIAGLLIAAITTASSLIENNDSGFYKVKQGAVSGKMEVIKNPGFFMQNFADIHTYKISDTYDFNNEAISVRFNDASTANITGSIKFRLSMQDDSILKLHQDFRSYEAVVDGIIRQVVMASLKQSATFFGAEEIYSTRRSEFIDLVNDQIKDGIYSTTTKRVYDKDEDGNTFIRSSVNISMDANNQPLLSEISAFKTYGIEVIQFVINDIDFDDKTDELIAKRKEADQEKVVAKAQAERAKQEAITATEKGKASIAEAEAKALVEKKTAVINAEREKEVAEQNALKAVEEKKKIIAIGEAEAESSRLKVAAGLTPLEKAMIDKDTAIGVAEKLAQLKFPDTMVIGGNGDNKPLDPFTAVGLKSFIEISKDLSKSNN